MKPQRVLLLTLALLALTASINPYPSPHGRGEPIPASQQAPRTDDLLQFASGGHMLGFNADAVYVANGTHAYQVAFVNPNPTVPIADASRSESGGAALMACVTYPNLWAGITLTFDAPEGSILRSTYRLEPYADSADIRLRYNAPVQVESDGTLTIAYAAGAMHESAPLAWQERNGIHKPVAVAFQALSEREVGFALGANDPASALFIDPTLTWNTFLGGSGIDESSGIAVDGSGNVYIAGRSNADWGSPVRAYSDGWDAFAAKLDANGGLIWTTFLGGSGTDIGLAIAVDGNGNVFIAGYSSASWGAPVRPYTNSHDVFIAKLDSSGGGLTWNTFLGGSGADYVYGIAADRSSNVYVAGSSSSSWGSPVRNYTNGEDSFAAKLDSNGGLTWNTFLGGTGMDNGYDVAVDGSGNVYLAGHSNARWGSPIRNYTSGYDGFATKLDNNGGLTWNTFLGGSGADGSEGIAVDGIGNVYVAGYSTATWGSPVRDYTGGWDGYAAKLDNNGGLTWNTFLGDTGDDEVDAIAVDGSGNAYVTGYSTATWGSPINPYNSGGDAFAARLDSLGELTWNTFLGGSGDDGGSGIAIRGSGNVYIAGFSNATWGAPIRTFTSDYDACVFKLLLNQTLFLPLVMR